MKTQYVSNELGACDDALQKVKSLQIRELLSRQRKGTDCSKKKGGNFLPILRKMMLKTIDLKN